MGKLLAALGEDNILWGTDSISYGSPQPLINAFRAFQILLKIILVRIYREVLGLVTTALSGCTVSCGS